MYMDIVHSVLGLVPFNFITPTICQLSSLKLCLLMRGPKYVVCGQLMLSLANERSEIMFLFMVS
jgi:succinate dehydrogenase/fumarate reductase cytochrome b subunit